ncbi:MAG: hypothetical protein PVSMB1_05720 [Gemmatimonadaceae bacterium]
MRVVRTLSFSPTGQLATNEETMYRYLPTIPRPVTVRSRLYTLPAILTVAASLLIVAPAGAQFRDLLRDRAIKKITDRKEKAESTVVNATDKATDSTLSKAGKGFDATVSAAGDVVDKGLNKTESGVKNLFAGRNTSADQFVADLNAGHVVLRDLEFDPGTAALKSSSDAVLDKLAKAMVTAHGAYLVEGHVEAATNGDGGQALSEQRAAAVKSRLVELGVSGEQLFAMGYGSARPLPAEPGDAKPVKNARVEIRKMH